MVWTTKASCIVMFGPTTDNGQVCVHVYISMYTGAYSYVYYVYVTCEHLYTDAYILYIHMYMCAYIYVYIHLYTHVELYVCGLIILLLFIGHLCSILAQC